MSNRIAVVGGHQSGRIHSKQLIMTQAMKTAGGGIRVEDITLELLNKNSIRRVFEYGSEELLALLQLMRTEFGSHGRGLIAAIHIPVNGSDGHKTAQTSQNSVEPSCLRL